MFSQIKVRIGVTNSDQTANYPADPVYAILHLAKLTKTKRLTHPKITDYAGEPEVLAIPISDTPAWSEVIHELHYENVWKLKRDEERAQYFENIGYKFLRWPYWLQLTKDVAKYYFEKSYTEDKYLEAIKKIYKVDKPEFVLSPGLHESKNTPANYVANGVRRFMKELDELPRSAKAQLAEGLRRYIEDVGDKYLVIGEQESFQELLKTSTTKDDLKIYYYRKK